MKNILYYSLILTVVFSCSQKNNNKSQTSEQIEINESSVKAYLMVYFKDEDHSLHMSLSNDGYSFSDINQGKAVIAGDSIAEQKGIRDPHIFRGPNNAFYLAMTDLHIFAKREGIRET